MAHHEGSPMRSLRVVDVVAIIVGLVVGAGIFKAPAVVAANSGSDTTLMLAWLLGGLISFLGALCYAELAASYPSAGGEYHFLNRAYGRQVGFLFAWSRLAVLQTGSIALLAFVAGDYLAELLPAGPLAPALYAAVAVVALTAVNIIGLALTAWTQKFLAGLTVCGLLLVVAAGMLWTAPAESATAMAAAPAPAPVAASSAFGIAMVFVLLTYGGWNEAAYISAELGEVERNMSKVLMISIGIITVLYLLVNASYLRVLGMTALSGSEVVTADVMRSMFGEAGAQLVSGLIVLAVLASMNVTILTGARANYALAQDFPLFRLLGTWRSGSNAPVNALLLQGVIALLLVFAGSFERSGFEAMVSYVSPVFWLFVMLTALALFVLRAREPQQTRPFRVPVYPLTPLVFVAACGYMLYASLAYSGMSALLGVALLAAGIPLLMLAGFHEQRGKRRGCKP
jgi:amino acid transporter